MKRIWKRILLSLVILCLSPFIFLAIFLVYYDLMHILPALPAFKEESKTYIHYFADNKSELHETFVTIFERRNLYDWTMKKTRWDEGLLQRGTMLHWHVTSVLWCNLARLHLTDSEFFSLWCAKQYFEGSQGIDDITYSLFGKCIDQLTKDEVIHLHAFLSFPTREKYSKSVKTEIRILNEAIAAKTRAK